MILFVPLWFYPVEHGQRAIGDLRRQTYRDRTEAQLDPSKRGPKL